VALDMDQRLLFRRPDAPVVAHPQSHEGET
jgi:hypothetical protein